MEPTFTSSIQALVKTLAAGNGYGSQAPNTLVQGQALQTEDLSTVMQNVCWEEETIKLQKMIKTTSCKSTHFQFNRQLSYGVLGDSAQLEGAAGQEETSDVVRTTVPMGYFSHLRRVTMVANAIETFDGIKAEDRASADAAKKVLGDLELECFGGMSHFSNGGVFDGNPSVIPQMPGFNGLDLQVRQSDMMHNNRDLMASEYGGDDSVVLAAGGPLTQDLVEDMSVRSRENHGDPKKLMVDLKVASGYNKIVFNWQRLNLAGSALNASGADLKKQFVSGGQIEVEGTIWLRGKAKPRAGRSNNHPNRPVVPISAVATSTTDPANPTAFLAGEVYKYTASSQNELGESPACAISSVTIATDADTVAVVITPPASSTVRYYNVYRTLAGGAAGSQKFIGRIQANGASTVTFTDLGNKIPGFVTGYMVQEDTMEMKELKPFTKQELAQVDLTVVAAFYRWTTLVCYQPRKSVLADNLKA